MRQIIVYSIVVFFLGCVNDTGIRLAKEPLPEYFGRINGEIGIRIQNGENDNRFRIEKGSIKKVNSLPAAPKEAASITAPVGLPFKIESQKYILAPPYLFNRKSQLVAISAYTKETKTHIRTVVGIFSSKDLANIAYYNGTKSIDAIAWFGSGEMLAILESTLSYGKSPMEMLYSIFGHPAIYRTYFLTILDKNAKVLTSARITQPVLASWGTLVWNK